VGRKTLRPYQIRLIQSIFNAWDEGLKRIAIAAATGAGKSVIFGEVARIHLDRFPKPGPIVLLVHRRELVAQAAMHFRNANPDLKVVTVIGSPGKKGSTARARKLNAWRRADILCTTPQTLGSQSTLAAFPLPSLIIVDEAHRGMAAQYMKVIKALGGFSGTPVLGVTATPFREDYREFSDLFQKIVDSVDISWLITHNNDADGNEIEVEPGYGYLVEPELHHLLVDGLDLSKVPMSRLGGSVDFREGALADALAEAGAFKLLVDAINSPKFASVKKGVIFAPTVESSKYIAEAMTAAGKRCEHVDGTTPKAERDRILTAWGKGEFGWVSNVDVLSEGYDLPDIEMVVLGGPTKSRIKFRQRIGRGLRPAPGKRKCVVLDVAGASDGMSLAGIESLTDVETVSAGNASSVSELLNATDREKRGRIDRIKALAERAAEIAARVTRARGQILVTVDGLKENLPGVIEFADAVAPIAEEILSHTDRVAEVLEGVSGLSTLSELSDTEELFNNEVNAARRNVGKVEEIKTKLRNSLATAQEEPESEVAEALITGNVQTVRGNLFGLGEERDKPGKPGEDINEITTRSRDKRPKPVIEQRYGWAITSSEGHLFAPVHTGGSRYAEAFTVAVKLAEDRYLPVYWDARTGDADDFHGVTTMDSAYELIIEKASEETDALNLLNPQAAWRKTAATPGSKSWDFARSLNPDVEIPDNATAGYIGDLITFAKNDKRINSFAKWVTKVR
jgi:superfamily II DNA or RNA helicase